MLAKGPPSVAPRRTIGPKTSFVVRPERVRRPPGSSGAGEGGGAHRGTALGLGGTHSNF